jgi:hypothetical protein
MAGVAVLENDTEFHLLQSWRWARQKFQTRFAAEPCRGSASHAFLQACFAYFRYDYRLVGRMLVVEPLNVLKSRHLCRPMLVGRQLHRGYLAPNRS